MSIATLIEKRKMLAAWMTVLEPAAIFVLIVLYIWRLRYSLHSSWIPILALVLVSHLLHKDRAERLGLRIRNFTACARVFSPALLFVAFLLITAGLLCRTTRPLRFHDAMLAFAAYLPWGLFQQYLLNSYFVTRLEAFLPHRHIPFLSAAIFSWVHLPNPFLMLVALGGGYVSAKAYLRYRNLYFLGLAHAVIGVLLFLVVPDSISHHLRVGPGWFLRQ